MRGDTVVQLILLFLIGFWRGHVAICKGSKSRFANLRTEAVGRWVSSLSFVEARSALVSRLPVSFPTAARLWHIVGMGYLRFATHPQVRISADIPVPRWGLNDIGRSRTLVFAAQPWLARTTRLISSDETKALETAAIIAVATGLTVEVRPGLRENDRSSTGYVPQARFEQLANAFFGEPLVSVEGWETAAIAQARVKAATVDLLGDDSDDNDDDVLIVAHGAVGTLLLCDLLGVPINRAEDQVGGDAAPGGGNYWTVDRSNRAVLHRWRPFEAG